MKYLILILLGIIVTTGVGYFVGYDHGFERSMGQESPTPTISLAADSMSSVVGLWESEEDSKFTREILNDGSVVDRYQDDADSKGRWMVFTKEIPDTTFNGSLDEGSVYLSLTMSETEKLYFRILRADKDSLELSYLDRGNTLSFTRIPKPL